jgi:hypothetical protein
MNRSRKRDRARGLAAIAAIGGRVGGGRDRPASTGAAEQGQPAIAGQLP